MNNKTFRALEYPLEAYANKAVVNCTFTIQYSDLKAYDFSDATGYFLSIYDRRGGILIKRWTDQAGLNVTDNVITWNERNQAVMNMSLGKYYYELGYTVVDYATEDEIPLGYGTIKFI